MNILCIDTETETIDTIKASGHKVFAGDMGYRKGYPYLPYAPHEYDLIVCDLRKPACYDATYWGPGRNDNYRCKIVSDLKEEWFLGQNKLPRPRYEIIYPSQMPEKAVGTFGPSDVFQAVNRAGIPFILFLNNDWLRHVGYRSPNFCEVYWKFERTQATKIRLTDLMEQIQKAISFDSIVDVPLQYSIKSSAHKTIPGKDIPLNTFPLVTNAISQVFGEVTILEHGAIWAFPQQRFNGNLVAAIADNFDKFLDVQKKLYERTSAYSKIETVEVIQNKSLRDVFISHASEDKDEIARPLAAALMNNGLSIWFDEYELTLGDRLRRKIEEGLINSRYGVTILSENFFQKSWPQEELDALFELEKKSKKILPIWHKLTEEDIRRYAPMLAGRLAISTDKGLDAVVKAIMRAVS